MKLFDDRVLSLRKAGDAARDARDYAMAEREYRKYLEEKSSDADIWVQLGHAVKEQRGHKAAIEFYARATREKSTSVDAYTHLAHALKNVGDIDAAISAFKNAHSLQPKPEYVRELRMLGFEFPEIDRASSLYFSVQDLIGYLNAHQTLSGIQRVQAGIISHCIASLNEDVRFIRTDTEEKLSPGSYWEIDPGALKAMIRYTMGPSVEHVKLRELLARCYSDVTPVTPREGDTVMLLGAFWGYGNSANLYAPAKIAGAKIGAYIYDLIPITHPEYCDEKLAIDFNISLFELSYISDFFLTISEFTARDLEEFLRSNSLRDIPVIAVPLAHTLSDAERAPGRWPQALIELRGARYVLYVSTIEGRKNHQYVVKIWQRLMAEGVDVPHLVFVGRMGWRIDALNELLSSTDNLDGRVHTVHDVSDKELNALYDGALFTTFTSFVEGWGLPVGESLMHGKPCIASETSSIPEVGGLFVDYINPHDIKAGALVFRKMIEDEAYRLERTRFIKESFVPRTWAEVAERLIEQSTSVASVEPSVFRAVEVPPATLVKPGTASGNRLSYSNNRNLPLRLLFSPHFYGPEHWGCWMKGAHGSITFRTPLSNSRVAVYLDLRIVDPIGGSLTFYCGSQRISSVELSSLSGKGLVRLSAFTDDDGCCSISIKFNGAIVKWGNDDRRFVVGVASFAYAEANDILGRISIVESLTFHV